MNNTKQTKWNQFIPLASVFFFWGFVAASNDILIPVFQKAFNLLPWQSQLVSFAFYVAYTIGSIIYIVVSIFSGKDVIERLGYKNSLALGLAVSAIGTILFYPAAEQGSFVILLSGLFIVGLGFSLQQTVANPLAIALGPTSTGSQRLTLAGGINNFGTTIGPLAISYAIFGKVSSASSGIDINTVKLPYLILGVAFLTIAVLLKFSSLPTHPDVSAVEVNDKYPGDKKTALHYPQLIMGMVAVFLYVGVEVSTASNLPSYLIEKLNFDESAVSPYISLYWASMMIGRWGGAVGAFTTNAVLQYIFKIVAPYLAFGIFLAANALMGYDIAPFYVYAYIIVVLIVADFISKGNPAVMLGIFSILGIIVTIIGMVSNGMISVYAYTSVGLFCSTLWPCIFTLAVAGLGKRTTQGSTLLIMMIMGGGIISLLQGYVAGIVGIQLSYIMGVLCFAYLVIYAFVVKKILKDQGIIYNKVKSGGH
ncbi:MFS transporter [Flavobacterium psychrotrophum]|uniref:MFS transporter n=1 Tax=Flavobacterium psychrotrophum TaxID=2294119 RepID=UPI000E30B551|nr:MFS transporter [Flavobacterium psychrotrophum]